MSSLSEQSESEKRNTLTTFKTFSTSVINRTHKYNESKELRDQNSRRSFENFQRKKLTKKYLQVLPRVEGTMYSDLIARPDTKVANERKVITPMEHVQKLVSDAVKFDNQMALMKDNVFESSGAVGRKSRVNLDKTLLKNHLRHTNVHNRVLEEDDMWKQRTLQKKRKIQLTSASRRESRSTSTGSMYADQEGRGVKVTRIDHGESTSKHRKNYFGPYTIKLLEAKEKDPNRWGNSGFKEMYAEELSGKKMKKKPERKVILPVDSDEDWEELAVDFTKNGKTGKAKRDRDITNLNKADNIPIFTKSHKKEKEKHRLGGLHADFEEEVVTVKKKRLSPNLKWNHSGFEALDKSNGKVRSLAVKKPPKVIVNDLTSSDVDTLSEATLNRTLHKEKASRKHFVLSSDASSEDEPPEKEKRSKTFVKEKQRVSKTTKSSSSESMSSDSSSSSISSSSSSHGDKYKTRRKVLNKIKRTFSDYDSDCSPRK